MNKIGIIDHKNILLLQGPMGNFFKNLDLVFKKRGAKTFKIGLNMGGQLCSNKYTYIPYYDKREGWEYFIHHFLIKNKIDKVFLFGDCRYYQRITIQESMKLNIDIFVFEEGYVRPDFVTMERYGVNNFSKTSRDPHFYTALEDDYMKSYNTLPAYPRYSRMAFAAVFYYLSSHLFAFRYPHYIHHREPNALKEFFWWWRNVFRKAKYKFTEKSLLGKLTGELSKKYYFIPLQTYNDFQLREHSDFSTIENFITEVVHSFAEYAPTETLLVIKHHPADRGRKNYETFITALSDTLGISERVMVIYDLHLPTCLQNAIGTVTINSTVGISSLFHHVPTVALGNAIYDIKGLTSKGMSLDDFWRNYELPDDILFSKFRNYLIETTQLNGSFYGRFPVEFENDEMYS